MNKSKRIILCVICILSLIIVILGGAKIYNFVRYEQRIKEILSDDKEIERKWLIDKEKIPYNFYNSLIALFV